jgi:hypothetical protein
MRRMRNRTAILTALLLACVLLAPAQIARAQGEGNLFWDVNGLRTSLGLAPYNRSATLDAAAAAHARWMVDSGQISHTQPDGSTPRVRAQRAGYNSNWVSENIYGGSNATASVAWNWWLNSPVHYRGITSPNYNDIGIGAASGAWGSAYVLLFGNSTGDWTIGGSRTVNAAATGGGNSAAGSAPPPMFVVGQDAYGNIMHEVQPGDTLGDIALLYGYTWDDLPYMLDINVMSQEQARVLEIGSVFLVPPQDGTYTPTPGGDPTAAPTETPEPDAPTATATRRATATATRTPSPTATETPMRVATGVAPVELLALPSVTAGPLTATPQIVAEAAEAPPAATRSVVTSEPRRPLWLIGVVGVQVVIVLVAGVEMIRRHRK